MHSYAYIRRNVSVRISLLYTRSTDPRSPFFFLPSQGQRREVSHFLGHPLSVVKKWRTPSWPQRANDPDCFLRRKVTSQRRSFVQTDARQQQPGSPRSGLCSHLKCFSLSTLEHGFICSYPSSARGGPHLLCSLGS
ncbi:unnamed protein product [Ixodes pacificus]